MARGYTTLKFEKDGKPCEALISHQYIHIPSREPFDVSFFIEIATLDSDSSGHPTEKEEIIFKNLQTTILKELAARLGQIAFVGNTTMTSYRDILLYIKPDQQEQAYKVLEKLKSENQRIRSFIVEKDQNWEAVSGFYEALEDQSPNRN